MAKLNSAEEAVLKEIISWKSAEPGFIQRATNFISRPISWAGETFIPDDVKTKLSGLTETMVDKLQDVSQWTVKEEDVLKATNEFEIDSDTILSLRQASVFDLDSVSKDFIRSNSGIAAAEGFGTGLIGWAGLIADMPALFTLSFRTIYQISLCYGFPVDSNDADEGFEVGYMLRIFRIATAASREEKTEGLIELKDYESNYREGIGGEVGTDYTRRHIGKAAAVQVSQMIINQIVKQTLSRKAVTSIPGIGALLTAGFNYSYLQDVGNAAFMLYRERFLQEKKGRQKVVNIDIA